MIMIPYQFLYPGILVFCAIGVFSLKNAEFDIYLMGLFGVLGYIFAKLGCEAAPMLLAFILGPLMEEYLRRAMLPLARQSLGIFAASYQCHVVGDRGAGVVQRTHSVV
jgi:TctA family transporter